MKLDISFTPTPDIGIWFQVSIVATNMTDDDCREIAEALRSTTYVKNNMAASGTVAVIDLALTEISRDVPLTT